MAPATPSPGHRTHAAAGRPRATSGISPAGQRSSTTRAPGCEGAAVDERRAGRAGRRAGPPGARRERGRRGSGRHRRARACTGCSGAAMTSRRRARLDQPAGVHHRDPVAGLRQHREVVADHDQRDAALAHQVGEQGRGSAPGRSRRGRWWARRRSPGRGGRPGPSPSSPAAAGRRRARGDSCVPARDGTPTSSSSARARARACFSPTFSCSRIGSQIWSPTRLDRVERAHRPLEDHRRLGPAHGAHPAPVGGRAGPRRWNRIRPVTSASAGSSRSRLSATVVLPDPDSPAMPSVSPAASRRSTPRAAYTLSLPDR